MSCSDTQNAHECLRVHSATLLNLQKLQLSPLAFQVVRVCIAQTQDQALTEASVVLGVQNCLNLAQIVHTNGDVTSHARSFLFFVFFQMIMYVVLTNVLLSIGNNVRLLKTKAELFFRDPLGALERMLESSQQGPSVTEDCAALRTAIQCSQDKTYVPVMVEEDTCTAVEPVEFAEPLEPAEPVEPIAGSQKEEDPCLQPHRPTSCKKGFDVTTEEGRREFHRYCSQMKGKAPLSNCN